MKQNLVKRYCFFLLGLLINSFGIVLITKEALGTSPISSVPYVISLIDPALRFGLLTFIMNSIFIVLQILLLRKDFEPVQLLQIVANFIFSYFIDVSMKLLAFLNPESIVLRLVILLLGCCVLAFGISIEVAPQVITVPGEGIVKVLAQVLHKDFGKVKVAFDTTLMCTALALSLIFFHRLNGLGTGTIISALIVGRIVYFYNHHLGISKAIGRFVPEHA